MRTSFWLLFGVVLLVSGLTFLSACPRTETEEGTGIERPGGEQVQPGTPARTGEEPTEGVEEQAPAPAAGEEGATADTEGEDAAEEGTDDQTQEEAGAGNGDDAEGEAGEGAGTGT